MKFKPQILYVIGLLVCAGCQGPSPRTVSHGDTGKINYSEYFENKTFIADDTVMAHLMITLGKERLPPDAIKLTAQDYRNGIYEAVWEIYFTNSSDKPVQIELVDLEIKKSKKEQLTPNIITVKPDDWVKSDPVVLTASKYINEYPYILRYKYKGTERSISGVAKRIPVEDIGKNSITIKG